MSVVFNIITLALIFIFAFAAVIKLSQKSKFINTLSEFGVSKKFQPALALLLPSLEIGIALTLLLHPNVRVGAGAATILIALFTLVILFKLTQGKKPKCNCFGQLSSKPIGVNTVLRNIAILSASAVLTARVPEVMNEHTIASEVKILFNTEINNMTLAVISLFILAQFWLLFHLFKQHGRMMLKIDNMELQLQSSGIGGTSNLESLPSGLSVGTFSPDFELKNFKDGSVLSLNKLRNNGLSTFLIFSDIGCGPCKEILSKMNDWEEKLKHIINIVVIMRGDQEKIKEIVNSCRYTLLIERGNEVSEKYQALATPSAVLVSSKGIIASQLALGADAIQDLLMSTINENAPTENYISSNVSMAST